VQSTSFKTPRVRTSHDVGMPLAISAGPYPWSGFMEQDWQGGRVHTKAADAVPPPTVSLAESATGWWEFTRSAPDSRLSGLVVGRCGYRERAQTSVRRRLPATSLIPVILSFGERLEVEELADGEGAGRSYESLVAGFQPGHALTRFTGSQFALNLYLSPLGVYRILGIPGSALAWGVHDLENVAPSLARSLPDRLASLRTWTERFAVVDEVLVRMLDRGPEPDPLVNWVWRRLQASGGQVRISDLVARSGWSHRHVISRFRDQIGVTPKVAANVIRFERTATALASKKLSLAEVAVTHGYADQSHLTREFVRFAGETPAVYGASYRPTPGARGQL
jgi:AraC-like DNA-binding protein